MPFTDGRMNRFELVGLFTTSMTFFLGILSLDAAGRKSRAAFVVSTLVAILNLM